MTTAIAPSPVRPIEGERRFLLPGVGWAGYQSLLNIIGDGHVRVTYARGNAELMSPLSIHERYKKLIGYMIEAITDELDLRRVAAGSTTFKSEAADRGLEPDECYFLESAVRLRKVDRHDLTIDPPPDLAVEVEITRSALNRLEIYAKLGVPEVWRFDGKTITVHLLGPGGVYHVSVTSRAFPYLPMNEITRFLLDYVVDDDTAWGKIFRAWVREVVVPLARGENP